MTSSEGRCYGLLRPLECSDKYSYLIVDGCESERDRRVCCFGLNPNADGYVDNYDDDDGNRDEMIMKTNQ